MGVVDQSLETVPYGSLREILAETSVLTYNAEDGECAIYVYRRAKEDRAPDEVLEALAELDQKYGYTPSSGPFHHQATWTGKTIEEAIEKAETYVAWMKMTFPRCRKDMWQLWMGKLNEGMPLDRLLPGQAAQVNGVEPSSNYVVIAKDEWERMQSSRLADDEQIRELMRVFMELDRAKEEAREIIAEITSQIENEQGLEGTRHDAVTSPRRD